MGKLHSIRTVPPSNAVAYVLILLACFAHEASAFNSAVLVSQLGNNEMVGDESPRAFQLPTNQTSEAVPTASGTAAVQIQTELVRSTAWSLPSFCGGVAVGVVFSIIMVAIFSDKFFHASDADHSRRKTPPPVDSSTADLSATGGSGEQPETGPEEPASMTHDLESMHLFRPRLFWLVAMLVIQSISSLILEGFEHLIQTHTTLFYFLTMLVGIGGNAGGQSAVLTVRRLALGQEVKISEQFYMGLMLSVFIGPLAFVRAFIQMKFGDFLDCLTIGISAAVICILAAVVGTCIPKVLKSCKSDPAHAAVTIQVLMDIVGILIVCGLGVLIVP